MTFLVPLPVILPLFGAGLALALVRYERIQKIISLVILSLVLAVSIALLVVVDSGTLVVNVGGWAAPVGIALVADRLSALMLTVSSLVTLCVLIYSLAEGIVDGDHAPVAIFHPTYLVLAAGVANAFLSGDLFNVYVGFEILLAASYVLLTIGGSSERIRAGAVYVVVAVVSSILFLIALALIYAATGTVNMAQLSIRLQTIDPGLRLALQALLLAAFGIKAAVFPLSAWLPDSYPTAPAPVTAVFAGLLTKVGVYAIIRTQTLLFPGGQLDTVLLAVALATMLVGILGAIAQDDIKRLLSFTLVSHIGFMVFGIGLSSQIGLGAAIFYVAHHITVQTALFLVVGLIERQGGSTSMDRLGGLAKCAPVLAVLFFIPAMNLAGVPPFSGFLGKTGLLEAGAAAGTGWAYALMAASAATSLLTLYALARAWNRAFVRPALTPPERTPMPRGMAGPAAALVAVGVVIAIVAGPLSDYTNRAAADLRARLPYIYAVFPDGDRGEGESPVDGDEGGTASGAAGEQATQVDPGRSGAADLTWGWDDGQVQP